MSSLVNGKIGYTCLVLPPRLKATDLTNVLMSQLQVNLNNVARATIRGSKSDRVKVEDLLNKMGLPSINRKIVYTIAMECWRALNLREVPNGPLNPLGCILSPPLLPLLLLPCHHHAVHTLRLVDASLFVRNTR